MFRTTDRQRSLWNAFDCMSDRQQRRIKETWAYAFRQHGLKSIDERAFAGMYHPRLGAPNKSVRLLVGVLILKDMFDLTDEEVLDALLFDSRWQVALDLDPAAESLCQKTLHNFRAALMEYDLGPVLFEKTTAEILNALGLDIGRQRMDSTHITAHVARLTRLGTCCETMRLYLRWLQRNHPQAAAQVSGTLRERYLKPDGSDTKYDDATREQARQRLPVAARDVYRLHRQFLSQEAIATAEPFRLLERCLQEQCEILDSPQVPAEDDRDAGEEPVPVRPRDKQQIHGRTLATPHDPEVTFGAKGLGYEVQIVETFGNKAADAQAGDGRPERPEVITFVAVTDSCASDVHETLPALADLDRRGIRPRELEVDSNFTSSEVVQQAATEGTDVNGPVKGGDQQRLGADDVTLAEFRIVFDNGAQTRCPQGHAPREQTWDPLTGKLVLLFDEEVCGACPLREGCPARPLKPRKGQPACRQVRTTCDDLRTAQRRRYQTTPEFRKRYANRAGIEATNSELKRGHGLGCLRVRRRPRVKLAVMLKVIACNVKRFLKYVLACTEQSARHPAFAIP